MNTDFDSINHVLVNGIHRKVFWPFSDNIAPFIDLSGLHLTYQFREIHRISERGRLAVKNSQPYTSVVFLHSGNILDFCQYIEIASDWSLAS